MSLKTNILSKENSLILRGLAIMVIMLHNFLHNPYLGFSPENEMSFSTEKAQHFLSLIATGQCNVYEIFSFLGWIGVVVFIYLTGYGISLLPPPSDKIGAYRYIKKKYLKLLSLLLPAIIIFMVGDFIQGNLFHTVYKRLAYITMMANVAYPWVRCQPGVYWYFSLTFQFYLIYAIFGRFLHGRNLLVWSILTIVGNGVLCSINMPEALSVYKHCFTGWFVVFAIGIWNGRKKTEITTNHSIIVDIIVFLLTFALLIYMNKWMLTWLFLPIVTLIMFFAGGLVIIRFDILASVFRWIGRLSACIFVCHPIIRFVINNLLLPRMDSLLLVVVIYIVATFLMAIMYDRLYSRILNVIIEK